MHASMTLRRWILGLSIALCVAACGKDGPAPVATAPPAQTQHAQIRDFVLLDAGSEDYNGRPALRLRFSQPLAAAQEFDKLLTVKGPGGADQTGGWVLDDDNKTLRFPYLQGDQTYTIAFNADIAAADGRVIAKGATREVYSGNLPPAVGFASQGSVLPMRQTDGLPIIAVNVPEVDVEFLRVRPASYSRFFANYLRPAQRSYWEMDELTRIAEPVYSNRFSLQDHRNQRSVSFIPVQTIDELREPGLYFAVMKLPGVFGGRLETTHFYVSDLAVHARVQKDRLWVHAASLADGAPRSSVAVEVLDPEGGVVASGNTDGEGDLTLAYVPKSEHVLLARSGSEIALIPFRQPALDLSEFDVAGRKHTPQDVYAWSGRDLFRPGEPLQVSALLRDHDGRALPDGQTLFATLRQPDGRAISTQPLSAGPLGYFDYRRVIAEDAATGKWTLEFRLDPGATESLGRFAFRVEEFLPERLKLVLESPQEALSPDQALPLVVDADYLYGAPAGGNRFTAEVIYRNALHPVASMPDYFFGDSTLELPAEPQSVVDQALGEDGTLQIDIPVLPDGPAVTAPVSVLVSGSVFESGGRAVRRSLERVVWPNQVLVGVRPLFDPEDGAPYNQEAGFEIVRATRSGALEAAPALQVKLIHELRDFHWSWTDGQGWRSDYTRRYETVHEASVAFDGNKPARFAAPVQWGEYRLEITDPQTGLVSRYVFNAGWSWDDDNRGVDARPDKVKLALDKTGYKAGDVLEVTITAPHEGPGVLLVESDKLLYRAEIEARNGATYEIPVSAEFERHDVYLTALVLRPAGDGPQAGPGRAIGIAHVPMAREDRRAKVEIAAPQLTRPGEALTIGVTSADFAGKDAYVVVEAVDLGIINLSGYPVPDAADYFLAQRGLGVEAYDIYGRVIERLEGERARLRFGGDAALSALPQARRPTAKVQTVALHQAPVKFDAQGKASVTFTAPEFNGTLRVAALAYSAERYGKSDTESIVRAPLVLEVSTPRALAPGDTSQISVDLHNLSGAAHTYTVSAVGAAPLSVRGATQSVELSDNQRRTLTFPLSALPGFGVGTFRVTAEGGDKTLTREFEIAVRPAWPAVRRSGARSIPTATTLNYGANLFEGLMPASGNALISVSTVPPIPFAASVKGLIGYPYGCIEQTSSRAWPLVWLDQSTARKFGLEPVPEAKRKDMLDVAFARLSAMQLETGHFAFWPGEGFAQPQMTPHVADLLLSAQKAGHAIPQSVLDKALLRLNEDLLTGGDGYYAYEHTDHLQFAGQAYAAYVLAKANRAPLGTLRTLFQNEREKSLTALPLVHLGLALQLQGDAPRGKEAIDAALNKTSERPDYLGDYGSRVRDEALLLALLIENNYPSKSLDSRIMALAHELREPERAEDWLSTQEQVALFRLGRVLLSDTQKPLQGEARVGDSVESFDGRALVSREFTLDDLRQGVSFALQGDGPFWISEDIVGTPLRAPAPQDDPVRIRRAYYKTDGTLFEGGILLEGETLIAKLTIEASEALPDALVVDLLPAGIEIENLALGDRGALGELVLDGVMLNQRGYAAEIRHEEFRDDRYVAALKLQGDSPAHLFYLVRAVSPGKFVVPPPTIEDMYRPRLRGLGKSVPEALEVKSP